MAYETVLGGRDGKFPIKAFTNGVLFEDSAKVQLRYLSMTPVVKHISVMPDVHFGRGATVGSVIATDKAIIPAAVGVDIGCGMCAVRTTLTSHQISDNGKNIFDAISRDVPHGGDRGKETGNWESSKNYGTPNNVKHAWADLFPSYRKLIEKNGDISSRNAATQLGTLGGGNHFIEICIDEADHVWIMLHSGSRGAGNCIGQYYISLAMEEMERLGISLPNKECAYLQEGTEYFSDYVEAVSWAQNYAKVNRQLMLDNVIRALKHKLKLNFELTEEAVNIHHNYVEKEIHFGEELFVTRKGAVSARAGQLGIIPGSMGTRSYITRGKGNPDSLQSCSHGAGRAMARGLAKNSISTEQHRKDTEGVFCKKDRSVIDESPRAYKDIDAVMKAQEDLVDIVHTLKQIVCVKG